MASSMLPYAVEYYNSLPELGVAKERYETRKASKTLVADFGKAFVAHHVESILGLALLHNHFLLQNHEILVNVDSVAVPWDVTTGAKELLDVHASSSRFTDDGIAPYEFAHAAPELSLDDHRVQAFVLELGTILNKWNLTDVLGICSLGGKSIDRPATMEFTGGRANITLPFDIAPQDGNAIDAMWQFSSNTPDPHINMGSVISSR